MSILTVMAGPCVSCGATNYPLSFGGPTICPMCDCGPPSMREVRLLRAALAKREDYPRIRTTRRNGGRTIVPVCPRCGRIVKAREAKFDGRGQPKGTNAVCSRCGDVQMPFDGYGP